MLIPPQTCHCLPLQLFVARGISLQHLAKYGSLITPKSRTKRECGPCHIQEKKNSYVFLTQEHCEFSFKKSPMM